MTIYFPTAEARDALKLQASLRSGRFATVRAKDDSRGFGLEITGCTEEDLDDAIDLLMDLALGVKDLEIVES